MSGFPGGRHDCADGGDCASQAAREARRATGRRLAEGSSEIRSIRTGVKGGLEEAEAMRGKTTQEKQIK